MNILFRSPLVYNNPHFLTEWAFWPKICCANDEIIFPIILLLWVHFVVWRPVLISQRLVRVGWAKILSYLLPTCSRQSVFVWWRNGWREKWSLPTKPKMEKSFYFPHSFLVTRIHEKIWNRELIFWNEWKTYSHSLGKK